MELAMEASPESFGTVIMLYINCKVSSSEKDYVLWYFDSLRWMVTMWRLSWTLVLKQQLCPRYHISLQTHRLGGDPFVSCQAAAERCGIMRLVDTRWAGIAKGVGTFYINVLWYLNQYLPSFVHHMFVCVSHSTSNISEKDGVGWVVVWDGMEPQQGWCTEDKGTCQKYFHQKIIINTISPPKILWLL